MEYCALAATLAYVSYVYDPHRTAASTIYPDEYGFCDHKYIYAHTRLNINYDQLYKLIM